MATKTAKPVKVSTKVVRSLKDLAPAPEPAPGDGAREWTAEILKDGQVLYAWMAYVPRYDTFATGFVEHARLFRSEEEVEAWAERLKVPNATPVRVRNGRVIRTPATAGRRS